MQPASRYTNVAIALHWIIALGIVINITLAWLWPHSLPDDAVRPAIDTPKSIGVTILGLAFLRLLWRFSFGPVLGFVRQPLRIMLRDRRRARWRGEPVEKIEDKNGVH